MEHNYACEANSCSSVQRFILFERNLNFTVVLAKDGTSRELTYQLKHEPSLIFTISFVLFRTLRTFYYKHQMAQTAEGNNHSISQVAEPSGRAV